MSISPNNRYESLDDKEVILGNTIKNVLELSGYQKPLLEILSLPTDMLAFKLPKTKRPVADFSPQLIKECLIPWTVEDTEGYRHCNTGKFVGTLKKPGRNPQHDIKINWLENYGRYKSADGKIINMKWPISSNDIISHYWYILSDILGIALYTGEDRDIYDREKNFLGKQTVLAGETDDLCMPTGVRHAETGICIDGDTWGLKGDIYYDRLHQFRIVNPTS